MHAGQMESILFGELRGDIREYIKIGGTAFLAVVALSFGETANWPITTGFETVEVGVISVRLSISSSIFIFGLIPLGVFMASIPARQNNGVIWSFLFGSVPIFGHYFGSTLYYGIFWGVSSLSFPPFMLLWVTVIGITGYILGCKW
ncbi:hypothetical protein [Haloprofundus halobius]|uniref:hypothetical protein n=1 Tax=Haloprofundus halobius TaxID=2876194 RepID=UPI001CCC71AD|nr:hypothetical protein [Haloprofundus halobius]